jgi:N6-adenosine-specific RNA methylase IME4
VTGNAHGSPVAALAPVESTNDAPKVWEGLTPPYATLVIDPPWSYGNINRAGIITRGRQKHLKPDAISRYSVMTHDELAALPVVDLAAEDAHCYLWTTNPMLPEALDLMAVWGFRYVTTITWRKLGAIGMGFYFRGDTEHVLFGVRGSLPIPPERRQRNWFEAKKTGHSRKPAAFWDLVRACSPGPYVDLFSREPQFGVDAWGWGWELAPVGARLAATEEPRDE